MFSGAEIRSLAYKTQVYKYVNCGTFICTMKYPLPGSNQPYLSPVSKILFGLVCKHVSDLTYDIMFRAEWFYHSLVTVTSESLDDNLKYAYRKITKLWDARKFCCNLPKIQTKRPNF